MKILFTAVAALILAGSASAQVKLIRPIKIRKRPPVARIEVPKTARPTAPIHHSGGQPGLHALPLVG